IEYTTEDRLEAPEAVSTRLRDPLHLVALLGGRRFAGVQSSFDAIEFDVDEELTEVSTGGLGGPQRERPPQWRHGDLGRAVGPGPRRVHVASEGERCPPERFIISKGLGRRVLVCVKLVRRPSRTVDRWNPIGPRRRKLDVQSLATCLDLCPDRRG